MKKCDECLCPVCENKQCSRNCKTCDVYGVDKVSMCIGFKDWISIIVGNSTNVYEP